MRSAAWFDAKMAGAGLVGCVGGVWVALLVAGLLDETWLLTGFLAVGLGWPAISGMGRLWGGAAESVEAEDEAPVGAKTVAPREEDEDEAEAPVRARRAVEPDEADDAVPAGPRMAVLMAAACLEATAIGLLAGYLSGSFVVLLGAGLVAGVVAVGITLLLAKRLSPAAEPVVEDEAVAPGRRGHGEPRRGKRRAV
jgi:hypothetical protein